MSEVFKNEIQQTQPTSIKIDVDDLLKIHNISESFKTSIRNRRRRLSKHFKSEEAELLPMFDTLCTYMKDQYNKQIDKLRNEYQDQLDLLKKQALEREVQLASYINTNLVLQQKITSYESLLESYEFENSQLKISINPNVNKLRNEYQESEEIERNDKKIIHNCSDYDNRWVQNPKIVDNDILKQCFFKYNGYNECPLGNLCKDYHPENKCVNFITCKKKAILCKHFHPWCNGQNECKCVNDDINKQYNHRINHYCTKCSKFSKCTCK